MQMLGLSCDTLKRTQGYFLTLLENPEVHTIIKVVNIVQGRAIRAGRKGVRRSSFSGVFSRNTKRASRFFEAS